MKLKSLLALTAVSLAALTTPIAQATNVLTFQNVTFTMNTVDANTFTLQIDNLLNATGDWAAVTQIGALAFKNLGGSFTGGTITPDGSSSVPNELNANGCLGGASGGFCFTFNPDIAALASNVFTIDLAGAGTLDFDALAPHLKVNFMNANGEQIGNLLSLDIPSSSSGSSNTSGQTPEPGSSALALLGLALVGGSFVLRRKQRGA